MTFKCSMCGETFQSGWTDEEALAEMRTQWGELKPDERQIVCSECHEKILKWWNKTGGNA